MAEGRRGFLAGLLFGVVPALAAAQTGVAPDPPVQEPYYRPAPSRPHRWCWIERQRIVVSNRLGRQRRRIIERQVCH